MSDIDTTRKREIDGLNRRVTEVEKERNALQARVDRTSDLDATLSILERGLRAAELETVKVRACTELHVPEALLDGFELVDEDTIRSKVAQLATLQAQTNTVAINKLLSSATLPGSGNVEPSVDPAVAHLDPATRAAYRKMKAGQRSRF